MHLPGRNIQFAIPSAPPKISINTLVNYGITVKSSLIVGLVELGRAIATAEKLNISCAGLALRCVQLHDLERGRRMEFAEAAARQKLGRS